MASKAVVSWACDRDPAHKAETLPDEKPDGWRHILGSPLTGNALPVEADVCGPCWTQFVRLLAGPRAPMFTNDTPRFDRPHDTVEVH
jgi:hypothetical protein